jgi:hypothetical protein
MPPQRLAEGDDRDQRREQRRHPEQNPGPRRTRRLHRARDEQLREPGDKRTEQKERPHLACVEIAAGYERHRRDEHERTGGDDRRTRVDVAQPREPTAHRDVQGSEEQPRDTCEEHAHESHAFASTAELKAPPLPDPLPRMRRGDAPAAAAPEVPSSAIAATATQAPRVTRRPRSAR